MAHHFTSIRSASTRTIFVLFGAACLLSFLPLLVDNPMLIHVWIMILFSIALGEAWNIVGGYAGQYSVGHAAYFGMGAYATMISLERWHRSPLMGISIAVASALLVALVIGTITFRLRGPYFVLASISVAEIVRLAALESKGLTRGAEGILLTSAPAMRWNGIGVDFASKTPFFYAALGLATLSIAATWVVQNSKLGYYFQAIREDQDAASSLGIDLTFHKNVALGISAVFTSATGGLWAMYVKFVDPNLAFGIDISIQMVLIAIIGGIGTILGPVVGAVVLVLISETLRNPKWLVAIALVADDSPIIAFVQQYLSNAHVLCYGILVVVVILFAPDGILGLLRKVGTGSQRAFKLGAALTTE